MFIQWTCVNYFPRICQISCTVFKRISNKHNNIMKQFLVITSLLFFTFHINAQVGIGTTSPDNSSILDITSANSGLLIPRVALLSNSDVSTIATPITSLLVYNSGFAPNGYYYWNGVIWIQLAPGSSNAWNILGNTNIVDGTNFIGTGAATNVDVAFRRNNAAAGKIGATSSSFGVGALNAGALTNNTAFGTNALNLSTGTNNVAFGNGTLASNTTGIQNTGVGNAALAVNTGNASTAVGFEALTRNTSGANGTAVGFQALSRNLGASNNTAVGFQTMLNNTTGSEIGRAHV